MLAATGTKWNFLPFKPGLVGGHYIGVDPYYLAQKAKEMGCHPEIILAGRRVNDSMRSYIAKQFVKQMIKKDIRLKTARILLMGFTFKENCPDTRNTRVIDIYQELAGIGMSIDVWDPWADPSQVRHEYNITSFQSKDLLKAPYNAIILAVSHDEFKHIDISSLKANSSVVYDVKSFLPAGIADERL